MRGGRERSTRITRAVKNKSIDLRRPRSEAGSKLNPTCSRRPISLAGGDKTMRVHSIGPVLCQRLNSGKKAIRPHLSYSLQGERGDNENHQDGNVLEFVGTLSSVQNVCSALQACQQKYVCRREKGLDENRIVTPGEGNAEKSHIFGFVKRAHGLSPSKKSYRGSVTSTRTLSGV